MTLLFLGFLPIQANAQARSFEERLTEWLNEPGVRMVVVEFYSDYCEPCKKAAPEWERLRKRYEKDGLRLVVINIDEQDQMGQCKKLPWNPWKSICSPQYAKEMGVTSVPQAFVWSWQGNLLMKGNGAHVRKARKVIDKYFKSNPRVMVEVAGRSGKRAKKLRKMVEAELSGYGKVQLVASARERKKLRKAQTATFGAGRRTDQQCEMGQEVSANSILEVEAFKGSLALTLQQLTTKCMKTVTAPMTSNQSLSVKKAVYRLLEELRHRPQMPGGRSGSDDREFGVEEDWSPTSSSGKKHLVEFSSTPGGAAVLVNGRLLCSQTPCKKALPAGKHRVEFQLADYLPGRRQVQVSKSQKVTSTLKPDFALVSFQTDPPGLPLLVNKEKSIKGSGGTLRLSPGSHSVRLNDKCFVRTVKKFKVKRGDKRTIQVATKPRPAGIELNAEDEAGNDVAGTVYVDGKVLGKTPDTFKVPVCSRQLEVRLGSWRARKTLQLKEKETKVIDVVLREPKRREKKKPSLEEYDGSVSNDLFVWDDYLPYRMSATFPILQRINYAQAGYRFNGKSEENLVLLHHLPTMVSFFQQFRMNRYLLWDLDVGVPFYYQESRIDRDGWGNWIFGASLKTAFHFRFSRYDTYWGKAPFTWNFEVRGNGPDSSPLGASLGFLSQLKFGFMQGGDNRFLLSLVGEYDYWNTDAFGSAQLLRSGFQADIMLGYDNSAPYFYVFSNVQFLLSGMYLFALDPTYFQVLDFEQNKWGAGFNMRSFF